MEESGRILLVTCVWTGLLAAGVCLALVAGQAFYLRQSAPGLSESGRSLGGGLVAGLVGSLGANRLYSLTSGGAGLDDLFRVSGWTVLGGLVGLGMAFFVPNLKKGRALLGGAIGGLVGGLGFVEVTNLLRDARGGDFVGRLVGALVVGFCIGLMVAWAERMFRKAWLEVVFGPLDKAAVNLGEAPVVLGSDRSRCTIYAAGAAPVAFRFRVASGKVLCEDVERGTRESVPAGHTQQIGRLKVTVHTSADEPALVAAPAPGTVGTVLPPVPAGPPPAKSPSSPAPPPVMPPAPAAVRTRGLGSEGTPPAAPDACPGCGRKVPGVPGKRFCMVCERTF
jgi:hypothetical protein